MKCLLIETKDKRLFFTHKKNLSQLTEFSKTFSSNIFLVNLEKGDVLELEQIAPAICSPQYKQPDCCYDIIEEVSQDEKEEKNTKTQKKTEIGKKIKEFIVKELLTKKSVSLKNIKEKFKKYSISDSTYYNQFKIAKKELEKKGFKFLKIKAGTYKAN